MAPCAGWLLLAFIHWVYLGFYHPILTVWTLLFLGSGPRTLFHPSVLAYVINSTIPIYFVRTRLSILVFKLIVILYSTLPAYLLARNSSSRRWRKSFQGWALAANQIQPMSHGTLQFHPPSGLCQKSFEILSWRSAVNSVCFTDIKTNSNLLPRGPWINCQLQAT